MAICEIDGCDKAVLATGLCQRHYHRKRERGDPLWEPRRLSAYERVMAKVAARPAPYDGLSPCWIFTGKLDRHGYGKAKAKRDGVWRSTLVHRIVLEHHAGPCPEGGISMHLCDERACVNPEHLRWGTHLENVHDMLDKGRGRWRDLHAETHTDLPPFTG